MKKGWKWGWGIGLVYFEYICWVGYNIFYDFGNYFVKYIDW